MRVWDTATGTLRTELTTQNEQIRNLAFSPDETSIAAAAWEGSAGIWDVISGRGRVLVPGGRHGSQALAFSPDGAFLACAGDYGLRIIAVRDGREVASSRAPVSSIVYHPDGTRLIGGTFARKVVVWDAMTAQEEVVVHVARPPVAIAAVPNGDELVGISSDGFIRRFHFQAGTLSVIGESDTIENWRRQPTAISVDGTRAASGCRRRFACSPRFRGARSGPFRRSQPRRRCSPTTGMVSTSSTARVSA